MASILTSCGFKNVESLTEFSKRIPNLSPSLDKELQNVWISHKNIHEISRLEDPNQIYKTSEWFYEFIKNKIKCSNDKVTLLSQAQVSCISRKILSHFGVYISFYLFTKCYVFYNWGINSFEPMFDYLEVHEKIKLNLKVNKKSKIITENCNGNKNNTESKKINLGSSKCTKSKTVSHAQFQNAVNNSKPYFDLLRNMSDPSQELFNLNRILYDKNEKPNWPSNHILSYCNSNQLLLYIVQVPVLTDIKVNKISDYNNWTKLKEILEIFIKNHRKLNEKNGYGRVLKRHLKKGGFHFGTKLNPIPKDIICSFIIDIFRKTLPLDLFGHSHLRKKFFSAIVKLLKETGSSGYGLRFYKKGEIESASSFLINKLLRNQHIKPIKRRDFEIFSVERTWMNTGVIDEKVDCTSANLLMTNNLKYIQPMARARFMPKKDDSKEMRMITYVPIRKEIPVSSAKSKEIMRIFTDRLRHRKKNIYMVKILLEYLVDKLGSGIKPLPSNPRLENAWEQSVVLKNKYGKLYFVKADITEAFDSIKYDVLSKILQKIVQEETLKLFEISEWRKVRGKIIYFNRLTFSNKPKDNCVVINRTQLPRSKFKNINFLEIIKQMSMQQKICINGRIYKLIKGLAQGSVGKFSPQLCELYYSSMDKLYFKEYNNSNNSILLRGVDDYLLITSDKNKAHEFLKIVNEGIKSFNVKFNENKLKTNLVENIEEVSYLGLNFNFSNMTVKPNYIKLKHKNVLDTIKLADDYSNIHFDKSYLLQKRSLQFNSVKLQNLLLNCNHNNLKLIRQIVYQASFVQSHWIMALAGYLFKGTYKNDIILFKILSQSCFKLKKIIYSLHPNETQWLFMSALLKVLNGCAGGFKNLFKITKYKYQNLEKKMTKNGFGLVIEFLKNDVKEEKFLKEIYDIFGSNGRRNFF